MLPHKLKEEPCFKLCKKLQGAFYRFHIPEQVIHYDQEQWQRLTGYTPDVLSERSRSFFFEIIHPDDAPSIKRTKNSAAVSEDLQVLEYRLVCSDGRVMFIKDQFICYLDDDGSKILEGHISESPQYNVRWRLLHQLKAYRDAVDVNMISSITDITGKIVYVNSNFCRISGYSVNELVGQNHRIIRSQHHSKEFFDDLWTTISSGKLWHGEILNRAKNGSTYWVDTVIIPIFNEEKVIVNYLSLRMLINDRKQAEEEFRNHTVALEKIAFMVAHEIRGPLCSILGLVNLLSEISQSDEEYKTTLMFLKQSATQLNELTRELSNFVFENEIEMKTRAFKEKIGDSKKSS